MIKRMVAAAVALLAAGAGIYQFAPGLRVKVDRGVAEVAGWTEEARRADPVGFTEYARKKLQGDLEAMQHSRRELAAEIGQLAGKLRNQQAFRDQARQLAEEFRAKYQHAAANGGFPVEVRGAAYTREQVKSQVSMILAETSGHEATLAKLEKVKKQAESQLESLTTRVNASESQLAAMGLQQEMLRAQRLSDEGEKLLAQVDQLLEANTRALEENPVRTVRELLTASEGPTGKRANEDAVEAFLAQKPTAEEPIVRGQQPAERPAKDESVEQNVAETGPKVELAPAIETKPVSEVAEVAQAQEPQVTPVRKQRRPAKPTQQQQTPLRQGKPMFQQY